MQQGEGPSVQAVQSNLVHTESYLERGKAGTGGGMIRSSYKLAEGQIIITLSCHPDVREEKGC